MKTVGRLTTIRSPTRSGVGCLKDRARSPPPFATRSHQVRRAAHLSFARWS